MARSYISLRRPTGQPQKRRNAGRVAKRAAGRAANHGFGMISMRRTAESYGGVMSVSCKNHIFSLDMTIPIKK